MATFNVANRHQPSLKKPKEPLKEKTKYATKDALNNVNEQEQTNLLENAHRKLRQSMLSFCNICCLDIRRAQSKLEESEGGTSAENHQHQETEGSDETDEGPDQPLTAPFGFDVLEHYAVLHGSQMSSKMSPFRLATLVHQSLVRAHHMQLQHQQEQQRKSSQNFPGSHLLILEAPQYPFNCLATRTLIRKYLDPVYGTNVLLYCRDGDITTLFQELASGFAQDAFEGIPTPRHWVIPVGTYGPYKSEQRGYCVVELLARLTQARVLPRLKELPNVPFIGVTGELEWTAGKHSNREGDKDGVDGHQNNQDKCTMDMDSLLWEMPSPIPAQEEHCFKPGKEGELYRRYQLPDITVVTQCEALRTNLCALYPVGVKVVIDGIERTDAELKLLKEMGITLGLPLKLQRLKKNKCD